MPRWLRSLVTGACFAWFTVGSGLISRVLLPITNLLGIPPRKVLFRCYRSFLGVLRVTGLARYTRPESLPELPDGAFVVVANHPTLIDVLFILGTIPDVCCCVNPRLFRSFFVGPLLRHGGHVPPELDAIVGRLKDGVPMLIFPEGTRSPRHGLNRFKRGAVTAALDAGGVPIVPVFLTCEPPTLMKGQKWWEVPQRRFHLTLEFLPVIHPTEQGGTAREITRELKDRYVELVAEAKERSEAA